MQTREESGKIGCASAGQKVEKAGADWLGGCRHTMSSLSSTQSGLHTSCSSRSHPSDMAPSRLRSVTARVSQRGVCARRVDQQGEHRLYRKRACCTEA